MTQGPGQHGWQDPSADDAASARAWGAPGRESTGYGSPNAEGFAAADPSGQDPRVPPGAAHPVRPYPGRPSAGQVHPYPGQPYSGPPYEVPPYEGRPFGASPYADAACPGQYGGRGQPFGTGSTGYLPAGPGYGYPPLRRVRPGGVVAAAVLSFVQSGLLLVAGFLVLAGADLASMFDESGLGLDDEFTVLALLTWMATGLLVAGGAQALTGRPWLLIAGCALSLVISGYWLLRVLADVPPGGVTTWPFLFAVLPIISIGLVSTGSARQWAARPAPPVA